MKSDICGVDAGSGVTSGKGKRVQSMTGNGCFQEMNFGVKGLIKESENPMQCFELASGTPPGFELLWKR